MKEDSEWIIHGVNQTERKRTMTTNELKRRYRDGAPIHVLAELNDCDPIEIRTAIQLLNGDTSLCYGEANKSTVLELHNEGLIITNIATKVGKSRAWVRAILNRYDLKPNQKKPIDKSTWPELYQNGLLDSEIAEQAGCSPALVRQWRTRAGLPSHVK